MFTLDIFASGNVVVYRGNSFTPTEKLTEEEKHFILDKVQKEFFGEYSEEKPMNQEGLEEEIHKYNKERFDEYFPEQDGDFISEVDFMTCLDRVARHFAKWGAEHLSNPSKMVEIDIEKECEPYAEMFYVPALSPELNSALKTLSRCYLYNFGCHIRNLILGIPEDNKEIEKLADDIYKSIFEKQ